MFDQQDIIGAEYSFLNGAGQNNGSSSGSSGSSSGGGGSGSLTAALPDIFGMASSWLVGVGRSRLADLKVSKLIADYWTTFATYGDPNGLRVLNGYKYRPEGMLIYCF